MTTTIPVTAIISSLASVHPTAGTSDRYLLDLARNVDADRTAVAARLDRIEARLDDLESRTPAPVDDDCAIVNRARLERLKASESAALVERMALRSEVERLKTDLGHSQRFLAAEQKQTAAQGDAHRELTEVLGVKYPGYCDDKVWGGGALEATKALKAERDSLRAQLADATTVIAAGQTAAGVLLRERDAARREVVRLEADADKLRHDLTNETARARNARAAADDATSEVHRLESRPVLTASALGDAILAAADVSIVDAACERIIAALGPVALPSPVVTPPVAGAVLTDEEMAEAIYSAARAAARAQPGWHRGEVLWSDVDAEIRAQAFAGAAAVRALLATPAPAPRASDPAAWMAVSASGRSCIAFARQAVEQQVADRGYPDGDRETVVYTPLYAAPAPRAEVPVAVTGGTGWAFCRTNGGFDKSELTVEWLSASGMHYQSREAEWRVWTPKDHGWPDSGWCEWRPMVDSIHECEPFRIVSPDDADADPSTRGDIARSITPPTSRRPEIGDRVRARIEGRLANIEAGRFVVDIPARLGARQFVWFDAADVELLGETGGAK